jgi:hypothetical protein
MGHVVSVKAAEEENEPDKEKLAKVCWVETLRKTK